MMIRGGDSGTTDSESEMTMREEQTGTGEERLGDCENSSGVKGC